MARVNPAQGRQNVADPEWFPVERVWAESHPESFAPLYGVNPPDPRIRLYRLLPAKKSPEVRRIAPRDRTNKVWGRVGLGPILGS